ncbi:MAG TPA: DUF4256 domain-containing protein [Clostridiales bacterium]|nr:DUF4256 domain-containing protein [Clostridiales bacterium]
MNKDKKHLQQSEYKALIGTLKERFEKNMDRHKKIEWSKVESKLEKSQDKLWSLNEMEQTGGEPDVIGYDEKTDQYIFCDCSVESPKGRRSLCYDNEALEARKANKPANSAIGMATTMGIEILTEEEYRGLQKLGEFDLKTSSWVKTPDSIRKLKGAVFCDRRYDMVFIYHNGAESYYSSRGFRGSLKV